MENKFRSIAGLLKPVLKSQSVSSIFWLFSEKAVRLGLGLFVGIWMAKYLGPEAFGKWNYAITIIILLQIFPHWGLSNILIKDLVFHKNKHMELMGSAFSIKVVIGVFLIVAIFINFRFELFSKDISSLLMIMSVVYFFQSFDVIDYFFQSVILSKYLSIVRFLGFAISSGLKVSLILYGLSLFWFSFAFLLEYMVVALGLSYYYRKEYKIINWHPSKIYVIRFLKGGLPLFFSSIAHWIYVRVDQVLIKEILDFENLGYYSASLRIVEGLYFLPVIVVSTFYPYLVSAKKETKQAYNDLFNFVTSGLLFTSILICIVITFFSERIIITLFKEAYSPAIELLVVHTWGLVFVSMSLLGSKWLILENKKRYYLLSTISGAILNLCLNLYLIPIYGGWGAAIATLIAQAISVVFINAIFTETRELFHLQLKSFNFIKNLSNFKMILK